MTPSQLLFAKTHEWSAIESDDNGGKVATVGISAFAVEALTDLVFMELPELGRKVKAGEPFGVIESVKAVSDLYAPVSGEIVAANTELPDNLERLNQDPYGKGWVVKIRLSDEADLKNLLDHKAYEKQCAEEGQ
ncbi:MAG: glycine cleavage system protein GcvH [Pirellulales bacterium]